MQQPSGRGRGGGRGPTGLTGGGHGPCQPGDRQGQLRQTAVQRVPPPCRRYTSRHGRQGRASMDRKSSRAFRRATRLVALSVAAACSLTAGIAGAAQASVLRPSVTLSGTYTLVHVDGRVGHQAPTASTRSSASAGRSYDVKLSHGLAFRSGDAVTMSGTLQGTTLSVQQAQITQFAADQPTVGGATKVLVVLATWTQPDATSQAIGHQRVQPGQRVVPADVVRAPVARHDGHPLGARHSAGGQPLLRQQRRRPAVHPRRRGRRLQPRLLRPGHRLLPVEQRRLAARTSPASPRRPAAGSGSTARWTCAAPSTSRATTTASTTRTRPYCTTPGTTTPMAGPDVAGDNCQYSDYGDPFDAMGASTYVAEYSASQKNVLGWLDAGRGVALTGVRPGQPRAVRAAVDRAPRRVLRRVGDPHLLVREPQRDRSRRLAAHRCHRRRAGARRRHHGGRQGGRGIPVGARPDLPDRPEPRATSGSERLSSRTGRPGRARRA